MNIQSDFEDFLNLLEGHQVDYMIIGELLHNKRSTSRAKDKADVEELS